MMTDILVFDAPRETGMARQMGERHIRSFLIAATRYLAPGRDLSGLDRLGAEDARNLPAPEFDRRLFALCRDTVGPNSGK